MKKMLARLGSLTKGVPGALITAAATSVLVILFSLTPAHHRLEYVLYDLRFKLKPKAQPLPDLVLLNVDDASISNVGVYPWPRHYYAYVIRQLNAVGLANLVFDFQFMDSSPAFLNLDALSNLYNTLESGAFIKAEDLNAVAINNDSDFASATEELGRVVMPFSFAKVPSGLSLSPEAQRAKAKAIARFTEKASLPLPKGREAQFGALADSDRVAINYPIPELMDASSIFGFVDNDPDLDGSHRRVRLIRVFDGRIYFHLSLVTFLQMCGVDIQALVVEPGKSIVIKSAVHPVTGKRGDISIPIDRNCAIFFDWMGDFSQTARLEPAYSLIEYAMYAEQFEMQLMLKDMVSGKSERVDLDSKLAILKAAILTESDFEKKFPLRREYRATLEKYKTVIKGYTDETKAEYDKLLTAKEAGQPVDEESLSSLRILMKAIDIKTRVDYLFDTVAVMGLTAAGTQDEGVTPLSNNYWMVGSYPTAINTMARGKFIREVPNYIEYIAIVLLAVGLALFIHDRKAKISYTAIGIVFLIVNAAIILLFFKAYLWLDQVSLNLAFVLPSALLMVTKFASEEDDRQYIQGAFSKYLSQEVINQIIANPDALKLGGQSCTITTFFSDVQGFSSISEKLSAEGLVQLLNEYLSEMTDNIMKNRGTVDKYEGDAIMAFWGAPLNYPEHPYFACLSALEMQRRLVEMRETWKKEGRHELKVRMGINSGLAVAGNMGSHTRMNYTVMGDSVNLASRLEGANKVYGSYTMVSENTWVAVKDKFAFRELDRIRVVGKSEPIKVFELLELPGLVPDRKQEIVSFYEKGLSFYKERRWKEALVNFVKALRIDMDDGPSKTYYKRCQAFSQTPPPENWDGVSNLSSK